jgi:hypothetical protein
MTMLKALMKELLGLFIEDQFLAIGILCVIAAVLFQAWVLHIHSLAVGLTLLVGCVTVLLASVRQTARHQR